MSEIVIANLKVEAEVAKLKLELWSLNYQQAVLTQIGELCDDLALTGVAISQDQGPWAFSDMKLKAAKYANAMLAKLEDIYKPKFVQ